MPLAVCEGTFIAAVYNPVVQSKKQCHQVKQNNYMVQDLSVIPHVGFI